MSNPDVPPAEIEPEMRPLTWLEKLDDWTGHRFYGLCLIASYIDCKAAGLKPWWTLDWRMVSLSNPIGFVFHLEPNPDWADAVVTTVAANTTSKEYTVDLR